MGSQQQNNESGDQPARRMENGRSGSRAQGGGIRLINTRLPPETRDGQGHHQMGQGINQNRVMNLDRARQQEDAEGYEKDGQKEERRRAPRGTVKRRQAVKWVRKNSFEPFRPDQTGGSEDGRDPERRENAGAIEKHLVEHPAGIHQVIEVRAVVHRQHGVEFLGQFARVAPGFVKHQNYWNVAQHGTAGEEKAQAGQRQGRAESAPLRLTAGGPAQNEILPEGADVAAEQRQEDAAKEDRKIYLVEEAQAGEESGEKRIDQAARSGCSVLVFLFQL